MVALNERILRPPKEPNMLSHEENELLTRIGPGTPMGALFRRFWLPALLSSELAESDCSPIRVRLHGEDLIAFRDTQGRVGLLGNRCPHRGASLFYGRNEENGLRCVYHGWKYDVTGQCVDMPSEPPGSTFKDRIRATAYPCVERAGVVWTYMGPADKMVAPPHLEWARIPESHVVVTKYIAACNYMQAMEGDIDSAHVSFLHKRLTDYSAAAASDTSRPLIARYTPSDRAPRFTVKDTDYGLMIAARRNAGDDAYYWRISQYLMPSFTMIGHDPDVPMSGHAVVPMDDEHVWFWAIRWLADRPFAAAERTEWESAGRVVIDPKTWFPLANKDNDYLINRDVQRTGTFTGIPGIGEQDLAVTESMGPIYDRSQEHLGTTDLAIIAARRRLLEAARQLQHGVEPYSAQHPDVYAVRPTAAVLKRDVAFDEDAGVRTALLARR
jgi:phenylpropionate dioxygenase-like ring-hydroxylating dioxygenase large terminal subunit